MRFNRRFDVFGHTLKHIATLFLSTIFVIAFSVFCLYLLKICAMVTYI
jgi:hypothetical protein